MCPVLRIDPMTKSWFTVSTQREKSCILRYSSTVKNFIKNQCIEANIIRNTTPYINHNLPVHK